MITRGIAEKIKNQARKGKAIILIGARQTGKTSLIKAIFPESDPNVLFMNGDDYDVRRIFENASAMKIKAYLGKKTVLIIDEAQRIDNIGLKMKLITDQIPEVQLVATGSSSFELANKINEPLTGRKREFKLFPISFGEFAEHHGLLEEKRLIPHRLVYGSYPEVATNFGDEREILRELSESYLYKDILKLDNIQKTDKLTKLLQALAFQIGSQVSYSELAQICGIDSKTAEKYIDILEKACIIFKLPSFSKNARNELKNSRKIYFYDNGIRNSIIADFRPIELRNDAGALWENYVVSERLKFNSYNDLWKNLYFWRTKEQKEIDLIEETDGKLFAFEFKYSPKKTAKLPTVFKTAYPNAEFKEITPDNVEEFLL